MTITDRAEQLCLNSTGCKPLIGNPSTSTAQKLEQAFWTDGSASVFPDTILSAAASLSVQLYSTSSATLCSPAASGAK